ncbi:sulfotransferase 1 family member D1-like [Anoplophora glabripennis]|uniref:sulfotransferase 1 family member D1-like n=1 Tax=Anoplophora glabripennis TaxID=217634 RepID=UPI00087456A8|nr:sulfotransferase 1 family member D1-like [Anoplophora glabripennis]
MSFTCEPFRGKYADVYERVFGVKDVLYEINPGKCLCCFLYNGMVQRVLDAPVRQDDTWLVSFPRTGSTWCQEMIWLIGNNLDFDTAKSTLQQFRAPLLESSASLYEYADLFKEKFTDSVEYVNNLPSPRFIKTHLAYPLLPSEISKVKPKIIYIIRNPKDVCVSYYFHSKLLHGFDVDFELFCELFLNDAVCYGGIFDHYLEFWNIRHESNILILRYEDMVSDTRGAIKNIAEFMEKPLSENDIASIAEFLSFKNMRKNRGCNAEPLLESKHGQDFYNKIGVHFVRQGKAGDWKNYMSPEMARKFDEYIEKHTRGTGLSFN